MKSILQNIGLVLTILLIASCDSGGADGVINIGVTSPAPQNGAAGSAVKGIISGGTVTVTDAAGAEVPISSGGTTGADGSYNLVFTEAAITSGITAPLTVTIDNSSGNATTVCDLDVANTTNDCPLGDGTFAAFGDTYPLPADFSMTGVVATIPARVGGVDPVVTVNVNPATTLAATLAAASANGSMLTAADVTTANAQVLSLIQTITGIDLSGQTLNEIGLPNLADAAATGQASSVSLALAAFSAAVVANQGAGETVADVITRLKTGLAVDANGNLSGTGTLVGSIATSVAAALGTVNSQLAATGVTNNDTTAAQSQATSTGTTFTAVGAGAVAVADPTGNDTSVFINKLASVISSALNTTGAAGQGLAGQGATEVFAVELDTVARLNEGAAGKAATNLDAAVTAELATLDDGATVVHALDANGVAFTITRVGTVVTVTDATSTWVSMTNSTKVVITATTGTSDGTTFSLPNILIETTAAPTAAQTTAGTDGDLLESFAGTASVTAGTAPGTNDFTFVGDIFGATAASAGGAVFAIEVFATADNNDVGTYSVTFQFLKDTSDALSINFNGAIGNTLQNFTVTAGSDSVTGTVTRTGTTDVDTFTDGTVILTLTLVNGVVTADSAGVIGTFTVSGVATATLDNNGTVTYTDGSVQSLPAQIF